MDEEAPYSVWAEAIRSSDERAFESLYRDLHDRLKAYARSFTADDGIAEDVVQESFIKLWQARQGIDTTKSLKAWMYTIVRNQALNTERARRNRDRRHDELAIQAPMSVSDEPNADAKALSSLLEQWINELPDRQREALRLSRQDGLSHSDVGRIMNVSQRTVNNHIVRALKYLRDKIKSYDESLLKGLST